MRARCACVPLLILFVVVVTPVCAAIYETSVPFFRGTYGASKSLEVDLGVSFQSIQSVSVQWSGSVSPGWWTDDLGNSGPDAGSFIMYAYGDIGRMVALAETGGLGGSTYPDSESFSLQNDFDPQFGETWGFLLDGRATFRVDLSGGYHVFLDPPGDTPPPPPYDTPPTGVLQSCLLVIDGIQVPEPSGLAVLAVGGVALLAVRRRRG